MAVKVDKEKCTGCAACVEVCPLNAIKIKKDKAVISDECVECGACINQCPNEAITLPR
jgi:Fe-S-cluster-containing hydrogenase component 2